MKKKGRVWVLCTYVNDSGRTFGTFVCQLHFWIVCFRSHIKRAWLRANRSNAPVVGDVITDLADYLFGIVP